MGGEAFKKRLVHSVALTIRALNSFASLVKTFIADLLKCKAYLKNKIYICVCVTLCSLVMIPFSSERK